MARTTKRGWGWGVVLAAGLGLGGCSQRPYRVFAVQIAAAPSANSAAASASAAGVEPVALGLPGALPGGGQAPPAHAASTPWDLNRVTVAALTTLPGMDAATAQAIVAHQPYPNKRDLLTRHVLTPAQYARWKSYLVVHRTAARAPVRRRPAPPAQ